MITITLTNELNPDEENLINGGLIKHNEKYTGKTEFEYLHIILKEKEDVLGGMSGVFIWDTLFINQFFVDTNYRNQGLGSNLLNHVEKLSLSKGINYIIIHAIDEPLKDYYLNRGYSVYSYLDNRPIGHRYYFLDKRLKSINKDINYDPDITYVSSPDENDIKLLQEKLKQEKLNQFGERLFKYVYVTAKNEDKKIIGGLIGYIGYDCLYIDTLWVHENNRMKYLGQKLVKKAEQYALDNGINQSFLGTTDFQAKPFYEKLGYEVFGINKDLPKGFNNYSMKKSLDTKKSSGI